MPSIRNWAMNNDPLLSIQDLRVRFKTFQGTVLAVDGINLQMAPGETVGLVGESGCGKSVTAMSILGLLPQKSAQIEGRIYFSGRDLLQVGEEELFKIRGNLISMIFQEPMTSLNPTMRIGTQIAEAMVLHQNLTWKEAEQKAVDILDQVQIPDPKARALDYPHRLSGGMRQRAMIAMALSCRPKMLLADEPTTALDVTIQAQIMDLMQRLKEQLNTAILLVTHDLGLIAEMVSRVIVMYAGQVVEEGPVKSLFRDPHHPYTQGLLGSVPKLGQKFLSGRRRLDEIKGIVPNLHNLPPGCRFNPRCHRVMERCRTETPELAPVAGERNLRCWLEAGIG
jgi:oligopeptide/dipeptide ABC transporter ATP-binding protein